MNRGSVVRVLSQIADTASETLEFQEVFDRVATSIPDPIPFDNMGDFRRNPHPRARVA